MTDSNLSSHYSRVCPMLAYFLGSSLILFLHYALAGTPIWFGLGDLGLTDDELLTVGKKAAVCLAVSAFLLVPVALTILVPPKVVRSNILFVFASLSTCVGPSVGIAFASYEVSTVSYCAVSCRIVSSTELLQFNRISHANHLPLSVVKQFPSLIGGIIGCFGTAVLIQFKVGLKALSDDHHAELDRDVQDIGSVSETSLVRSYHSGIDDDSSIRPAKYNTSVPALSEGGDLVVTTAILETEATTGETSGEINDEKKIENNDDEKNMDENNGGGSPVETVAATASMLESIDEHLGPRKSFSEGYLREMMIRTFPIWAVVLILILTRVEQIGIKEYLTKIEPYFSIHFGTYGTFRLSSSIVFQLRNILTYPNLNWKYELLYIPFIMPFVLVSAITMVVFRKDMSHGPVAIAEVVAKRLQNPAIALLGALVLVQLMIRSGTAAPAFVLGNVLADWFQEAFIIISPLLGALGSFFSGSTTVSNLTFGDIQLIAAESIGTSVTSMLALQTVGASAGNGICLNNIIAACAVVGLDIGEGKVLMKTYKFVFASTTISTVRLILTFL
jgi:L-lactate permease